MATATLPSYSGGGLTIGSGGGGGPYGSVPAPISVTSPYQQTAGLVPGLPNLTGGAASVVGSELSGNLSPGTVNMLGTAAAERGVGSGMPGSGLSQNDFLNSVGISSEQLTQQGVGNYLQLLTGLGSQQINPATQVQVGEYNSTMGAAPDPAAASTMLENLLNPTQSQQPNETLFTPYGANQATPIKGALRNG